MKVGDPVKHSEYGVGVIGDIKKDGRKRIIFSNERVLFGWLSLEKLNLEEKSEFESKQFQLLTKKETEKINIRLKHTKNGILKLLNLGDFKTATKIYHDEKCEEWWSWNKYQEDIKSARLKILKLKEKEKKERIRLKLLRKEREKKCEEKANHREKERIHQEILRKEMERKRNELWIKIHSLFKSDFFKADSFYYEFCTDLIAQDEFKKELENHLIFKLKNSVIEADNLFFNQKTLTKLEYDNLKNNEVRSFLQKINIPLNDEQITAISAIDKNVLLKARAGSGKTSVVTARTFFLIHHEHIHPYAIMLLAFNTKAAKEMASRIKEYGELEFKNARTFHSLAYQLVKPKENLLFDESNNKLSSQRQSLFIQSMIKNAIDDGFKDRMYEFFREETDELNYLGEFLSKDDYLMYRRNHQQITLRGYHVKSLGCKYIGDFLFEHDVKHRYRYVWYWKNRGKGNYRPDFTVFGNRVVF